MEPLLVLGIIIGLFVATHFFLDVGDTKTSAIPSIFVLFCAIWLIYLAQKPYRIDREENIQVAVNENIEVNGVKLNGPLNVKYIYWKIGWSIQSKKTCEVNVNTPNTIVRKDN